MMKRFVCALLLAASFLGSLRAQTSTIANIPSILDGEPSDRTRVWFMVDDLGLAKTRRITLDHLQNLIAGPTVKASTDLAGLANQATGTVVHVLGYSTTGDGGEGFFWLDTSGTLGAGAANGGTIFAAAGGTNWYWRRMIPDLKVTPQMFGAKGDNVADDTAEIQAMADYCDTLNATTIKFPTAYFPMGYYKTNDPITFQEGINVVMDGEIVHDGSSQSEGALIIGATNVRNRASFFRLKVHRLGLSDWSDDNCIGIKMINTQGARIELDGVCDNISLAAGGFTIGFQGIGSHSSGTSDMGFAYNTIIVGGVYNSKYAVDFTLESGTGGGLGYCNENKLFGGSVAYLTGSHLGDSRYGWRLSSKDGSNRIINNNVWHTPSLEVRDDEAKDGGMSPDSEGLPVWIINGQQNKVLDARNESNGTYFARVEDDPVVNNDHNVFTFSHSDAAIDDQSRRASSMKTFTDTQPINRPLRSIYDTGRLSDLVVAYSDEAPGQRIHVPGLHVLLSGADTRFPHYLHSEGIFNAWVSRDWSFSGDTLTDTEGNHEKQLDDLVFMTTTVTLPTGFAVDTPYYVVAIPAANQIKVSATKGGTPITPSGGSGTHTYHSRNRFLTLSTSRAVGVMVDVRRNPKVVVSRTVESGFGGRVGCHAYDSANTILKSQASFTADEATETFTSTAHGLQNDERVYVENLGGAIPAGLTEDTQVYHLVNRAADTFQLSLTKGGAAEPITDNGTGTHSWRLVNQWVKGDPTMFQTTAWGGTAYINGSDLLRDVSLTFRSEVKRASVWVSGGSNALKLQRFQLFVPEADPTPDVWVDPKVETAGYTRKNVAMGGPLAEEVPAFGVYDNIGMKVMRANPTAAEPMGWILSAPGTPGTWLNMAEFGALAP